MSDGKVTIDVLLDSSQFEKGISKLSSAAKTGVGVATKAITAASTALLGMGAYAIKVGSSFEAGMSEVQAISGATGADLQALREKAKEMGATTKFSATESAEALKYMAMAGWDSTQMVAGLPGVMNLAAASGESLAATSDIVTDALTAFGLQAEDSAHFADVLAKAASSSNTNVGMMGDTFKYVAPIAGAMKYSIEDTAVAIGLMANAGIKGERAGTALRSILTRLVKPPADAAKALDSLGISATNSDGSMKPLGTTLKELREKFAELSDSEKAEYAANIAGQEAMSGLLAIVNASSSDFNKLTQQINNADGAAEAMAETMNDNLSGQITILRSALEGLGIEIYESVDNPLKNAAKSAIASINSITEAFKKDGFKGMAKQMGTELANALTQVAKAAPKMISAGADAIKAFIKGIKNNAPELRDAAIDIVKALADGVASLLPKQLGNACKALINVTAAVAKPLLTMAGAALKAASALSGLGVAVVAAIAAYKGYAVISAFVKTLALVKSGAMFAAQSTIAMTAAQKVNTVISVLASAKNTLLAGTTTAMSLAQKAAVVSTNLLNAALTFMGGPIGIVVAAIGLLVGGIMAYCSASGKFTGAMSAEMEKANELAEAQKELSKTIRDNSKARSEAMESAEVEAGTLEFLYGKLAELDSIENKNAAQKTQMKAVVDQLNEAVPELGLAYDEEADSLNKSTEEVYKAITAQKSLAMAKAAQEQMTAAAKDMVKVEMELADAESARADTLLKLNQKQSEYNSLGDKSTVQAQNLRNEISGLEKAYEKQGETVDDYKKELKGLNKEYDELGKAATKYLTSDDIDTALGELCAKASRKAEDIPKAVSDGIKTGSYQVPQSIEELDALIQYDDLVNKANEAGRKIPDNISKGAAAGGENLTAAVNELSGLVNFDNLISKARTDGVLIPQSLINGVNEGKLPIPTTMGELNSLINFNKALSDAGLAGKNIPKFLSDGLTNGSMSVDEATKQLGAYINFQESLDEANRIGAEIPKGLANKVKNGKVTVEDAQKQVNNAIKKKQDELPGAASSVGSRTSSSLRNGISSGGSAVASAAKSVMDGAKSKMKGVNFSSVGSGISSGTARGINSSSVINKAVSMARSALSAAKKALGIHSPSKIFRAEVGAMVSRGFALGIEDESKKVVAAVNGVVDEAVGSADTSELEKKLTLSSLEIDAMYDRAQRAVLLQTSKIPAPVQEFISKNIPYADSGAESDGSNVYEIHIHTHIGPKEVAETTAVYTDNELGRRNKFRERGHAG